MKKIIGIVSASLVVLALAACSDSSTPRTVTASASESAVSTAPPATVTAQPQATVTAQPPATVTAQPPPVLTVTAQPPAGTYCSTLGNPFNCDPAVFSEPGGLLCSDLQARGWGYYDALYYWDYWGKPSNMDIDNNGIPCQTVYPEAPGYVGTSVADPGTVNGFPSPDHRNAADNGFDSHDITGLPSGLLCQDLRDRGYNYWDAYDYWSYHGEPSNMDADSNGIPCETVWTPAERYSGS